MGCREFRFWGSGFSTTLHPKLRTLDAQLNGLRGLELVAQQRPDLRASSYQMMV